MTDVRRLYQYTAGNDSSSGAIPRRAQLTTGTSRNIAFITIQGHGELTEGGTAEDIYVEKDWNKIKIEVDYIASIRKVGRRSGISQD